MRALQDIVLQGDAERVRRDHAEAIRELQAAMPRFVAVSLADGVATPVPHGLGRTPHGYALTAPIGPSTTGHIEEIRTGGADRKRAITLKANGYGATVTLTAVFW